MKSIICENADQTQDLARCIGKLINSNFSVALLGDLGAGKTTFVQGLAKGLGVPASYYITSPTYNIINEYPAGILTFCHIDLYRLGDVEELEYIGFDDLTDEHHVIAVEWPDLLFQDQFIFDLNISFELDEQFRRNISLTAQTTKGKKLLLNL